MLFPERMFKVEIYIPEDKLDREIESLGRAGVVHIDDSVKSRIFENEAERVDSLISLTKSCMDILGIKEENLPVKDISLTDIPKELNSMENILNDISKTLDSLSSTKKRLAQERKNFSTAESVKEALKDEIDIEKLSKELKFIKMKAIILPSNTLESLLLNIRSYLAFPVYSQLTEGSAATAIFYTDDLEDVIEKGIEKSGGREIPLNYFDSSLKSKLEKEMKDFEEEKEKAIKNYKKTLLKALSKLKVIKKILETENLVRRTAEGYVVEGWIPVREKEKLLSALKYSKVVFKETNDAPVLLKTPKILKPFEELVTGFSYPSYNELNPTPFFALIFVILFGVMFGDLGHGIVLAIAGYILSKKTETFKSYGKVLVFCGISSAIFGLLYGSVFGNEHLIHPLLFNPMENIDKLIVFSLGIGVFVLSLGFLLNIYRAFREKRYGEMVAGEGGLLWFVIYWFMIGIVIKAVVYKSSVKVEVLILLALVFVAILYEIIKKREVFGSVLEGFMALLESITGTVSFVRLGAFTLAHAALMLAIFAIGKAVSSPHGTGIGYWVVMILGNLLVIVLEALVVSIQTMRLEYYEFFGRFYKGGGKPFKPFKLEGE